MFEFTKVNAYYLVRINHKDFTAGIRLTKEGFLYESSDNGNHLIGHKWIARLMLLACRIRLSNKALVNTASDLHVEASHD